MAFENGYNMFNYCEDLLQNIKKINLYFTKALQILSVFERRNDYPYCTDELSEVCEKC